MSIFAPYSTTIPGYPRVGPNRQYKTLLEAFWSHKISSEQFASGVEELKTERLATQAELDLVPCGDFSLYDHVLDAALQFGCVPERFGWDGGPISHDLFFAMARGRDGVSPLEMTKWFDTNYHYLVPELPERFVLTSNRVLEAFLQARSVVGDKAKPVLLGPFSFLRLARLEGEELAKRLEEILPLYETILSELEAPLIQMDEPFLVCDMTDYQARLFRSCYERLGAFGPLLLQTYYGDVNGHYEMLCGLPVAAIGLDFVRGRSGNLAALQGGFPLDKILVAGVVNGRNIWRTDLDQAFELCQELAKYVPGDRTILSSSCTLLHLPESLAPETSLPSALKGALSFAQERLKELQLLSTALRSGRTAEWQEMRTSLDAWKADTDRQDLSVQARVRSLSDADAQREPYSERKKAQDERLGLPLLPTTTIGSFPQTPELRKARAGRARDPLGYETAILKEIESVVRLQERIGLDVLVHGEPERNDMVQFFGDQMKGFATTLEGWVQSYGSRCVRPPIIYGDVDRLAPMTVKELSYAMSLTSRPMKGMLTGPITILQWSFVRDDIPWFEVAYQIALAIRDEVRDLEEAGLPIVQIDEAAFREGLPLRAADRPEYVQKAVWAFRLATGGARPETQIHTHMCYSDFGDMIEAIAALDADVISIEDARSDGALLGTLRDFQYPQQIGPGVYDIHSPNVPDVEFVVDRLRKTLGCLPVGQIWVNPDCGLKTRRYEEVVPALENMVAAAALVRQGLGDGG